MALYTFAILGIPPFGSLLAGKLGDLAGTGWSLFLCGGLCAVSATYLMKKIDQLGDQIDAALAKQGG